MTITPTSPYITPLSSDDADEPPTRPPVDNCEAGVGCQVCVGDDKARNSGKHFKNSQQKIQFLAG